MDKKTYDEMQKALKEINLMLEDPSISKEDRQKLDDYAGAISGSLMRDWLPRGFIRRLIMVIIFFISVYGIINISLNFIFFWLLLILFSPRAIGEIANMLGKIANMLGKINNDLKK